MLNGAGMLHGGCLAYIVDKYVQLITLLERTNNLSPTSCCSTPLVVLGLIQNVNGVGVTQSMNVLFHAPAPL